MLVGQFCYISHKVSLIHTVRNLGYHNLIVGLAALNLSLSTHHDTSASRLIGIANTLQTINIGSCGEVGTRNILHQSISIDIWVIDVSTTTIDNFTKVMGRHVSSHTNGNTVTTVHQEVRYLSRHHRRLHQRVVEIILHIDCFLLQVVHDVFTHLRKAALCVSHSSRRVTVDRAEVTLTVNQRIAHVPVLSHTDEGAIDRSVAVGVVLT